MKKIELCSFWLGYYGEWGLTILNINSGTDTRALLNITWDWSAIYIELFFIRII